jgi:hypothetical protein
VNRRYRVLLPVSVVLLVSLACTISLGAPEVPSPSQGDLVNTSVAQTIAAGQPVIVQQPTATTGAVVQPPTQTPAGPHTNTPKPCNQAAFITETIPDGTQYNPNTNFTKTWRFRNDGTCTWNTNYQLVFYSGDQMGGTSVKNFTQNVTPGEQVDISVALKSPSSAGTYKGYWKLRSDSGEYYVSNLWAQIEVKSVILMRVLPDLRITSFTINPATPTMGVPATVTITAYNGGGSAGPFMVRWYGLSTFPDASCAWAFPGLAGGASKTETCTFTFGSWYPINKTSIVYIDHDNQVTESNEANNSASISPFGVKAP